MNSEQISTSLVVNEWQLNHQLSHAISTGKRNKFNLLLSFLSNDARDFAMFHCPDGSPKPLSQIDCMRQAMQLPPAQPLEDKGITLKQAAFYNQQASKGKLADIRLSQLIHNEALLSRPYKTEIDDDVMDNLSMVAQQRLQQTLAGNIAESSDESQQQATGVDYQLMTAYQKMQLDKHPIKLTKRGQHWQS